jgi:hypothetical protein
MMAKKARKKSIAKAKKAKRANTKIKTKAKSNTGTKKKPAPKSRRKPEPKGITEKVASAFHTMVDTIKETDTLRNKMEPPGASETS